MATKHYDFAWVQTRLTLARWYLHAAANAAAGAEYHHLRQARNVYEDTIRTLSHLSLDEHQRGFVVRELAALRVRLPPTART